MQDRITRFLGISGGLDFDADSGRDVAWLGNCDDGCQLLAEKLGWGVSNFHNLKLLYDINVIFE